MERPFGIRPTDGDSDWFIRDRFGMFIHFGLYALPARHEWVKSREHVAEEAYDAYFRHFDPDLFNAREWAQKAKAAGMRYAVLTAKHHEGFCLFDSQYTDYKITNTPFGRDLVREYAEAFREAGLKVGLYYSLLDWHHPDYTIDGCHPRINDPNAAALNEGRDMHRYAAYIRDQVRELLTNYGKIDLLFFDFSIADNPSAATPLARKGKGRDAWESEELVRMIRSLCPDILINDRLGLPGDIQTPEQAFPPEGVRDKETGERVVWETCQTFSGSWGYNRAEASWKTPRMIVEMMIRACAGGGNLLMNVGPTARGVFDERAEEALSGIGEWMRYNGRSIYGCGPSAYRTPDGCLLTESADGKRLYLHLLSYPFPTVTVEGIADRIEYAQLLHDGGEIFYYKNLRQTDLATMETAADVVSFKLPLPPPRDLVPVVEIFLK